jgi:hypothetical protein
MNYIEVIKAIESDLLVDTIKKELNKYIEEESGLPKRQKEILGNSDFYLIKKDILYYFLLTSSQEIRKKYLNIDDSTFFQFMIAVLLYRRYILTFDGVIDSQDSCPKKINNLQTLLPFFICSQEGIRILSNLFSNNKGFWTFWSDRKNELINSYLSEFCSKDNFTDTDYEKLVDHKTSLEKIVFHGLFILSKKENNEFLENLFNASKYFYVGYQIMEDVTDFEEDYNNGQFNIMIYSIKKHLQNKLVDPEKIDLRQLKTYLYTERVVLELLDEALKYLEKSKQAVRKYSLEQWNFKVDIMCRENYRTQEVIKKYLNQHSQ